MSLLEIVDNSKTDKNTKHSYLDLYQKILVTKEDTATNILEIGILDGGSIKLWHDYFKNATIFALDIMNINNVWTEIKNKERIILYTSHDAYDIERFKTTFLDKNIKFDILIDDGPHTFDSMVMFIKLYSQIMTSDGILIIEDVPDWKWIKQLKDVVPDKLKQYIKVYDLRSNKNRFDDIVFTIDKCNNLTEHFMVNNNLTNKPTYYKKEYVEIL